LLFANYMDVMGETTTTSPQLKERGASYESKTGPKAPDTQIQEFVGQFQSQKAMNYWILNVLPSGATKPYC